jgi:hypothetical protein
MQMNLNYLNWLKYQMNLIDLKDLKDQLYLLNPKYQMILN